MTKYVETEEKQLLRRLVEVHAEIGDSEGVVRLLKTSPHGKELLKRGFGANLYPARSIRTEGPDRESFCSFCLGLSKNRVKTLEMVLTARIGGMSVIDTMRAVIKCTSIESYDPSGHVESTAGPTIFVTAFQSPCVLRMLLRLDSDGELLKWLPPHRGLAHRECLTMALSMMSWADEHQLDSVATSLDALIEAGAPLSVPERTYNPVLAFITTTDSPRRDGTLQAWLGRYVQAGYIDVDEPCMSEDLVSMGRSHPLAAAIIQDNPVIAQALIELGCRIDQCGEQFDKPGGSESDPLACAARHIDEEDRLARMQAAIRRGLMARAIGSAGVPDGPAPAARRRMVL